jgi:ketosteroid isomerase-like protein
VGAVHAVDEVLARFRTEWTSFRAIVDEYLVAGETVIALGTYHGRPHGASDEVTAAFAHVYDIRHGRIIRFRQYTDTAIITRPSPPREVGVRPSRVNSAKCSGRPPWRPASRSAA